MNKPAPKEPSMDEILSSIRQIIADDDAAAAPVRAPVAATPAPLPFVPPAQAEEAAPEPEPLALSTEQMLDPLPAVPPPVLDFSAFMDEGDEEEEPAMAESEDEALKAEFIDPEDIAFEPEP